MTEVHDQSYRRYRGSHEQRAGAWTVIATAGIRAVLSQRKFLVLLLFAWAPFVVRAFQFYAAANFPGVAMLTPTVETYRDFLDDQSLFVFFVTIYVGAGLVANDRRANALQIYLSKPLTRAEYIAGKLAILFALLLVVTWIPGMLLLLLQVMFAGSLEFLRAHPFVVPAMTLFILLEVLLATSTMLALSSLSTSSRYVGILYAGAVLFTDAMANVLRFVTGGTGLAWISLPANLKQVGDLIFRVPLRFEVPPTLSLMVIVGVIGVSMVVLERRIRGVEVVA